MTQVIQDIGVREAQDMLAAGQAILVDVRDPAEFAAVHVDGAVNVPLSTLTGEAVKALSTGKMPILVCKTGMRSGRACDALAASDVGDVRMLAGGMGYWQVAGLPVVVRRDSWWARLPLERQVQVVVGGLVGGLSLLALTVSPWFALGTLAIGAGLMNAGVTGWCGMAKVLARLT